MIEVLKYLKSGAIVPIDIQTTKALVDALRQAIAELESQEPVAWITLQKEAQQIVESKVLWKKFIDGTPLANEIACWMANFALQHTHPPQRTWVGLTNDELTDLFYNTNLGQASAVAQAIALLKEKNT